MPGHMNVLLAEADVPYDQLRRWRTPTPSSSAPTSSLVIGANDVTNPAAKNTPSSPIYGMPILEVSDSHSVIVIKRSMNPGFAGIENELYYDPKTAMLFGDAKSAVAEITAELPTSKRASARLRRVIERSQALAALTEEQFDVVVVGGGITGAGVALDAPRAATASRCWSAPTTPPARRAVRASSSTAACATCRTSTSVWSARRCSSASCIVALAPHLVHPLPLVVPAFDGARPDRLVGRRTEPL